ncbi:hypothetical protein [Streptomyces decoyicus]|uniref:hypothetical protein n=1 Tax=Streptomyces decoyicus TaxID=249567 RepID=UPI0038691FCD
MRVAEYGTGSGYSTELIARLVGTTGEVTSLDIDVYLTPWANLIHHERGLDNVRCHTADGSAGGLRAARGCSFSSPAIVLSVPASAAVATPSAPTTASSAPVTVAEAAGPSPRGGRCSSRTESRTSTVAMSAISGTVTPERGQRLRLRGVELPPDHPRFHAAGQ